LGRACAGSLGAMPVDGSSASSIANNRLIKSKAKEGGRGGGDAMRWNKTSNSYGNWARREVVNESEVIQKKVEQRQKHVAHKHHEPHMHWQPASSDYGSFSPPIHGSRPALTYQEMMSLEGAEDPVFAAVRGSSIRFGPKIKTGLSVASSEIRKAEYDFANSPHATALIDDPELKRYLKFHERYDTTMMTDKEVILAHTLLQDLVERRYKTIAEAFYSFDEDKSGKLSRLEILKILVVNNFHTTPPQVFDRLMSFCEMDDGEIDYNEFAALMRATPDEVMERLAGDGDGGSMDNELQYWLDKHTNILTDDHEITYQEMATAHAEIRKRIYQQFSHLTDAFRVIDEDCTGFVTHKNILHVCMMFELHKVTAKCMDMMIDMCDTNGDGMIDYNEFAQRLMAPTETFMSRFHGKDDRKKRLAHENVGW